MWYRPNFTLGAGVGKGAGEGASSKRNAQLQVRGLQAGYGPIAVLRGVSFDVKPGLTVILGPNGAGKTTLLRALNALIPRQGDVLLDGDELPDRTDEIVKAGIALVAEGRQLFGQMTVLENLELGGWLVPKAQRAGRIEAVFNDFPKLRERASQLAGTMSGGEQQMVAVARAMVCAPRMLMLDEPSLGLAPKMVDELLAIARRIADAGTTVLMVEQNVKKALAVADRGYVLERGQIVASGPAKLLARSSVIQESYLGATNDGASNDGATKNGVTKHSTTSGTISAREALRSIKGRPL
jgi:branched-chain amino acid transport system ATP-binding protein